MDELEISALNNFIEILLDISFMEIKNSLCGNVHPKISFLTIQNITDILARNTRTIIVPIVISAFIDEIILTRYLITATAAVPAIFGLSESTKSI